MGIESKQKKKEKKERKGEHREPLFPLYHCFLNKVEALNLSMLIKYLIFKSNTCYDYTLISKFCWPLSSDTS